MGSVLSRCVYGSTLASTKADLSFSFFFLFPNAELSIISILNFQLNKDLQRKSFFFLSGVGYCIGV